MEWVTVLKEAGPFALAVGAIFALIAVWKRLLYTQDQLAAERKEMTELVKVVAEALNGVKSSLEDIKEVIDLRQTLSGIVSKLEGKLESLGVRYESSQGQGQRRE